MSDESPSETEHREPPAPRSIGQVLDNVAEDQRQAGLPPLSKEEAMDRALRAQRETRQEQRWRAS